MVQVPICSIQIFWKSFYLLSFLGRRGISSLYLTKSLCLNQSLLLGFLSNERKVYGGTFPLESTELLQNDAEESALLPLLLFYH